VSAVREKAGAAVSLGNVTVDLKVHVKPSGEVDCTLVYRGQRITAVFQDDEVRAIRVPPGSVPDIYQND
jgi:hypothetical protein